MFKMDFDSCTIDFSDLDGGCISTGTAAAAVPNNQQQDELPWPPIFNHHQNNGSSCWVKDFQTSSPSSSPLQPQPQSPSLPSPATFISRGNFSCYRSFMEACKREETIEELLNQQNLLQKEVLDLHRQNYLLENEKEKLINELINSGIKDEIEEMDSQNDEETQTVEQPDAKTALIIAELEAKLLESQERCEKLEKEKSEHSDKIFELDMDKQRLNIKLHHYMQVNKSLEENNDELEKETRKLKAENEKLSGKLENLEQKIERIEDGDFEHVSCDDSIVPTVILI